MRNREKELSEFYLQCIKNIDYDKEKISVVFIVNDSTDDSLSIIEDFKKENYGIFHDIKIVERNVDYKTDGKIINGNFIKRYDRRGRGIYKLLADLRNMLLEIFLESGCDRLFSVDSDIEFDSNVLKNLLAYDKDIISATIDNGGVHNIMFADSDRGYRHLRVGDKIPKDPFECDLTGAIYLINRNVIGGGVRYGDHDLGEDIPFCESAKSLGFKIWGSNIKAMHHM